jgi:negative regulator of flagellin synthesis FlgM
MYVTKGIHSFAEKGKIMSMKINGDQGVGPVGGIREVRKPESSRAAEAGKTEDKVAFSSILQEVNRSRQAQPTADAERAEKIQALKEQIADGSYRPDLTKVAASLLKFIAEGKK